MNKQQYENIIGESDKKLIMLEIMDEINDFCMKNNLEYFLVGGTLLGAIRHKGFIPWDDDIDIGLPRKDYIKLMDCFESTSGNVCIADYHNNSKHKWANGKAYNKRTILIENGDKKRAIGVFVDVFPFDGLSGTRQCAEKEVRRKTLYNDLLALKHLRVNKSRPLKKNILIALGKLLYILPDTFFISRINASEKDPRDIKDCDYVCNFTGAWGVRELTLSKNFRTTINAEFEGRIYKIPIGYDDYLKTVYGDYMTPPPKEKQVSHHSSVAYWKE